MYLTVRSLCTAGLMPIPDLILQLEEVCRNVSKSIRCVLYSPNNLYFAGIVSCHKYPNFLVSSENDIVVYLLSLPLINIYTLCTLKMVNLLATFLNLFFCEMFWNTS